jgi:4-hydroxybenzoate polyprenyltransferase
MNWAWFFIIFFYTSAITFPFEIRDLKRDDFTTLPMKIGIQKTKYLSYIFLCLSSVLTIYFLKFEFAISLFLTFTFASILIYFSHQKREDWYYSFLMESLSLLPFIFHELFKIF